MILRIQINHARGERYRQEVTDVHVEIGSHHENRCRIDPPILEGRLRSSRDDPLQLIEKLRPKRRRDMRLFATFEVVCVHSAVQNVAARIPRSFAHIIRINLKK